MGGEEIKIQGKNKDHREAENSSKTSYLLDVQLWKQASSVSFFSSLK